MSLPSHLNHLAIIMDGNGRWAETRGYPRTFGHLRGARVARNVIELCAAKGLPYLTLYAFSTENWLRPKEEVAFLMRLLARHMQRERATLIKNNIQFRTIGDLDRLPALARAEVDRTILETKDNTGMTLFFALSYGGRQEIVGAMKAISALIASGEIDAENVTEDLISSHLQTSGVPDPDLIIRTSGESRLSNFFLWQSAYSEFYFTQKHWPEFSAAELENAFAHFSSRERRFGNIAASSKLLQLEKIRGFVGERLGFQLHAQQAPQITP